MGREKNKAAQALARLSWAGLTAEQRAARTAPARAAGLKALNRAERVARAEKAAKARWAKVSEGPLRPKE